MQIPHQNDKNSNALTEEIGNVPHSSDEFRKVPHFSETFGNIPHHAEAFRIVRNDTEISRTIPHSRTENHTLTVREAARLFEAANVARSERSIINWCHPNRQGIPRLDAYFDPNERRFFITQQSVDAVIEEEKVKTTKSNMGNFLNPAEEFGRPQKESPESFGKSEKGAAMEDLGSTEAVDELIRENRDLQITNRAKDMVIEQLRTERNNMLSQLVDSSRQIGVLETQLLQLNPGNHSDSAK